MKRALLFVALLYIVCSCSPVRRLERVHTTEANNLLESYYETVWNPENNRTGERDSIKMLIRVELKKSNHK